MKNHSLRLHERFVGLENLLLPSFTSDMESLDEGGIRRDIEQSVRHGFFGTQCVLDTQLSDAEIRRFIEVAVDEAADRLLVGVSLLRESVERTVQVGRWAQDAGCQYAVLGLPLDLDPEDGDDVRAFVETVAGSLDLGIVLPISTHLDLQHLHPSGIPLDTYDRLADIDNVFALRVDSIEPGLMFECFERYSDRISVTSSSFLMLPLLVELYDIRWSGGWSPEALQSPEQPLAVECFERLRARDTDTGMQQYWSLIPAYRQMATEMGPVEAMGVFHLPLIKYYQWLTGGNGGVLREPSPRIFQRAMDGARRSFSELGIHSDFPDEEFYLGRSVEAGASAGVGAPGAI